ncbi:MAG: hypothetical protein B7Z37_21125 [Verrucomicrobia bacterium 12-59-8]|nr:MAG: hypothetical protein B7Z37_21125 [Verrucomicrobia bacterium 12-59-8]
MKTLKDFLKDWNMSELQLNLHFLSLKWEPKAADQTAAWDLYVELLTRISTQALPAGHGDEKTALTSVYSLFETIRTIIKKNGKECLNFAKIAIPVLNQIVRPFTAHWHKASLAGAFDKPDQCRLFRTELAALQQKLNQFTILLAALADVEDISYLEAQL